MNAAELHIHQTSNRHLKTKLLSIHVHLYAASFSHLQIRKLPTNSPQFSVM